MSSTLLARVGAVPEPTQPERRLTVTELRGMATEILDRLEEPLSVDDLATVAGRTIYAFCRAFRESTGTRPYQYVIKRRLNRAREMPHGIEAPLAEIAYACGFSSQPYFSNAFGKHFNQSPGRYRRANRKSGID